MIGRLLLIGQDSEDLALLQSTLKENAHWICRKATLDAIEKKTKSDFKPDLVVMEASPREAKTRKALHYFQNNHYWSDIPILLLLNTYDLNGDGIDVGSGVQDFLVKPVQAEECMARLTLVLRKNQRVTDKNIVQSGDLQVDLSRYEVRVKNKKVDLTYTEYELLKFFAQHPGQVFHRDVLLNKVWGYDYFGGARTVDVHVRRLRAKIERDSRKYIETLRHVGYKFVGQEED